MTRAVVHTPAPFARGDRVEVAEEHLTDWRGTVGSVKFSPVSGWWLEVEDEDGTTWSVPAGKVKPWL